MKVPKHQLPHETFFSAAKRDYPVMSRDNGLRASYGNLMIAGIEKCNQGSEHDGKVLHIKTKKNLFSRKVSGHLVETIVGDQVNQVYRGVKLA